jgi:phage terminase small subunit
VQRATAAIMAVRSKRTEVAADRALLEIARVGFSDLRRLFDEHGRLKPPHEWDDDTAASVASIEIATRNMGDGTIEYIRRIKFWDKGKALEQLSKHLGLYRDQGPSEPPAERPLSHLRDEELIERILYLKGMRAVKAVD